MRVGMKGTEAFMSHDSQSKSLCDPLYGEVAELLKFEFIHNSFLIYQEFEN